MESLREQKPWFLWAAHLYQGVQLLQHPIITLVAGTKPGCTIQKRMHRGQHCHLPTPASAQLIRGAGRAQAPQRPKKRTEPKELGS
jgi:hypothetical protein